MSAALRINSQGACLLGGVTLHPPRDPLAQAAMEVGRALQRTGPNDTVVLAGAGLGWHARALLDLPEPPGLIIYEPDPASRELLRRMGPPLPEAAMARNALELAALLADRVVYNLAGWVSVYSHPAYRQNLPHLAEEARRLVRDAILRGQVDRGTRAKSKRLWLENLASNFKLLLELPDLALLGGALRGAPALVIGAGPSLDHSLAHIPAAGGKALLFAAASALGPLQRIGVVPHLALALEGSDESRQFSASARGKTLLAAASSGNPAHFQAWAGPKGLFHLLPWVADLAGLGPHLPSGGHATSAAFSLAVLWGCDPIILVGQDLAYSGGRMHASARPGGEDYERPATLPVAGLDGNQAETSTAMHSYINWYQEAVAYLQGLPDPPRLINATAEGARLPGFVEMPLGRALESLNGLSTNFNDFMSALGRVSRSGAGPLTMRLAKAKAQVKNARQSLAAKGLVACRAGLVPGSAAAFALDDLFMDADPALADERLQEMSLALSAMAEALYA